MNLPREAAERMLNALGTLECELASIRAQWNEVAEKRQPWQERLAAHQSLEVVVKFLDAIPEWNQAGLSFGLTRLLLALNNIDRGESEPFLKPEKSGGGVGLAPEVKALRGHIAGVVELLRKVGKTNEEADRWVYERIPDDVMRWLMRGAMKHSWRSVERWREAGTGNRFEDTSPVVERFQRLNKIGNEELLKALDVEAFATDLIQRACQRAREMGAGVIASQVSARAWWFRNPGRATIANIHWSLLAGVPETGWR